MVGVWGPTNYKLVAQLPMANICNWEVDFSNLPCGEWGIWILKYKLHVPVGEFICLFIT